MILENLNKIKLELSKLISEEDQILKSKIDTARRPEDVLKIMRDYKKKLSLRMEMAGFKPEITKTLLKLRALYVDLYNEELQDKMLQEHTQGLRKQNEEAIKEIREELGEYHDDLVEWNESYQSETAEFLRGMQHENDDIGRLEDELASDQSRDQELDQQLDQEREGLLNDPELQEQEKKFNYELDKVLNKQEQTRVIEQAAGKGEEINREALEKREQRLEQAQPKPIIEQNRVKTPAPKPKPILREAIKKSLQIKGMSKASGVLMGDAQQRTQLLMKNVMDHLKAGIRSVNVGDLGENLEKTLKQFSEDMSNSPFFKKLERAFGNFSKISEEKQKLAKNIEGKTRELESKVEMALQEEFKTPTQTIAKSTQKNVEVNGKKVVEQEFNRKSSEPEYKSPTPFENKPTPMEK